MLPSCAMDAAPGTLSGAMRSPPRGQGARMTKHPKAAQGAALVLAFEGDSVPDWVHLFLLGEMTARDGRTFRLSDPAALVASFEKNGADLPFDIEHATSIKGAEGEEAPAVGWIKELDVRADGIWARVDWTERGADLIRSRSYRYASPGFMVEQKSGEVLRLLHAALTNQPALPLNPLTAREQETDMDNAVLEALGLKPGASAADAVNAIAALREERRTALARADTPDAAKFVPRADHDAALARIKEFEAENEERATASVEAAVDAAIEAGKITPAGRDYHVASCQANGLETFQAMVAEMPVIAGKAAPTTAAKTETAKRKGAHGLTQLELATAKQLGVTAEKFAETKAAQEE